MPGALVLALGLPTIAVLLATGLWADRRFARFDQLPAHYDFKGRPTRFAPRRLMAWLLPIALGSVLAATLVAIWLVPPEMQNGDPLTGAIFLCVTVLGTQGLILWLHERWANRQKD